jgi:hypothetical protein
MTHGSQVVDFSGFYVGDDCDKVSGITKVTVVKEKLNPSLMSVFVDVVNTSSVECGCTTNDTMNLYWEYDIEVRKKR